MKLELAGAEIVAHGVVGLDYDAGIIAPAVGIADLVGDGLELDHGLRFSGRRHPVELLDVLAQRLFERVHHLQGARLAFGAESPLDVLAAQRLAQCAVGEIHAALPARPHGFGTR